MEEKSNANLILARQLRDTNSELRVVQVTNEQLNNDIGRLTNKIEEDTLNNFDKAIDQPLVDARTPSSRSPSSVSVLVQIVL